MANFANNFWEIITVGIFGAIGLIIMASLGTSGGSGSTAENWSTLFGAQLTGNVSIMGVGVILVIIGGVMGFLKFIKK
jgi:hypothetical protein